MVGRLGRAGEGSEAEEEEREEGEEESTRVTGKLWRQSRSEDSAGAGDSRDRKGDRPSARRPPKPLH